MNDNQPLATSETIEAEPVKIAIHRTADNTVSRVVIYGKGIKIDISDQQPDLIHKVFSEEINAKIQPALRKERTK